MTSPSPTARELAEQLVERWLHGDEKHRQWLKDIATPDIESALLAARRDALEERPRLLKALAETIEAASLLGAQGAANMAGWERLNGVLDRARKVRDDALLPASERKGT